MHLFHQFSSTLILGGAVLMAINLFRFRHTLAILNQFDHDGIGRLKLFGSLHQLLMGFFFIGYLAVAFAMIRRIDFVGDLFVALIFVSGACFVWMGIYLQNAMIAMINERYDQARTAGERLAKEQHQLEKVNRELQQQISERRKAELALKESEQRLKTIIDTLPACIMIIDAKDHHIMDANPAALDLIGAPADQVIGARCHQFICPAEVGACPISDLHLEMLSAEKILLTHGGDPIPILKSVSPIKLEGRNCLLEIFIDLSEQKRLEAQLQRAQKMEALGTLAGGVAHDLNNILSGLVSYPELLLVDLPADSPLRKPLQTIQKSGDKAARIVQDLLTLARRGVAAKQVVDFNKIIEDYLESPEHEQLIFHHPDVSTQIRLENDLLHIKGSPVHLTKTLMNLVSNAAEAMPFGGQLEIETSCRYIDTPIKGYDDIDKGDYVVLTVSDAGVGIKENDLHHIFEPFYTKKKMGRSGTGLGMAVVWGTVKDHQGYIHVNSIEDRGTTFTLYFPATRQPLPNEAPIDALSAFKGAGQSILVIDDVAEQREIAGQMLTRLGYQVHEAASGEEAVAFVRRQSVDLLLLDMIMSPGIDGLETFERILVFAPGQRAVIASGYSETESVSAAQAKGAGPYIKKPYTLRKLGAAVKEALEPAVK